MDEFADENEISMNANFEENDELRQNGEIGKLNFTSLIHTGDSRSFVYIILFELIISENNQELEAGEREGESEDMNPNEGNNFEQMEKTTDDEER